jgi:hypothetical protein
MRIVLPVLSFVLVLNLVGAPFAHAGSTDVLNGSVAVPAVNWVRYPVIVSPGMLHPRLSGRLTATGGTGNDIVVAVMNDADFTNWANGHTGSPLYNSGQVTVADVKVDFPESGVYVVLFDNKFSGMTAKTVAGRLRLLWDDPPPPPAVQATSGTSAPSGDGKGRTHTSFYLGIIGIALCGAVIGGAVTAMALGRRR